MKKKKEERIDNMMPNYFSSPGEVIKQYADARGIKQIDLANRIGMSEKHISNLLNGKTRLTEDVALNLEKIFSDIPANFWLSLEMKYREHVAREKSMEQLLNTDLSTISKKFNFNEVFKGLTWSVEKQANEMLKILGISDFNNFEDVYNSKHYNFFEDGGNRESIVVWLKLCEKEVEVQNADISNNIFSRKRLLDNLGKFKMLAMSKNIEQSLINLRKLCNELGIYLVVFDALQNSKIRGALTTYNEHPAIYLSLRFKTHDHLWFSFFHEMGHLVKHYEINKTFISYDLEQSDSSDDKEKEAHEFAKNILIDSESYVAFISEGDFSKKAIIDFAYCQKVLPGIIVGRLQHENIIEYEHLNDLKEKF